jgi:hypothetical protein
MQFNKPLIKNPVLYRENRLDTSLSGEDISFLIPKEVGHPE